MAASTLVAPPVSKVTFAAESSTHHYRPDFDPPSYHAPNETVFRSPILGSPRPPHHRRRSRQGSFDAIEDIARAFHKVLSKSQHDIRRIARDFFACAVGLSAGHKIKSYTLDRSATAMLAVDLSKVILTTDILMVLDTDQRVLYVLHTQILSRRFQSFPEGDDTIFVKVKNGSPRVIPTTSVAFMSPALDQLKHFLRSTSRQVVTTSSFGWRPIAAAYNMLTLGDWLLNYPVCYVVDAGIGAGSTDVYKMMSKDELCWKLDVRADGVDPDNDHTFGGCQIPASLFTDKLNMSLEEENDNFVCNSPSLDSIQNRVQTEMFERLNETEMAASIWTELTAFCEGPQPFSSI